MIKRRCPERSPHLSKTRESGTFGWTLTVSDVCLRDETSKNDVCYLFVAHLYSCFFGFCVKLNVKY